MARAIRGGCELNASPLFLPPDAFPLQVNHLSTSSGAVDRFLLHHCWRGYHQPAQWPFSMRMELISPHV
jgi:hypothetical protein